MPTYPTLNELFETSVKRFADNVALRMLIPTERKKGRGVQLVLNEITYSRLGETVGRLAAALQDLGVQKGDRVALVSKPRAAYAMALFAVLRCGAAVLPLDPDLQRGELKRILEEAGVSAAIFSGSKTEDLAAIRSESLPNMSLVCMDRTSIEGIEFMDAVVLGHRPVASIPVTENDLAILMYTSGTTGNAKGAMLTHKNIASNALTAIKVVELSERDNFLTIVPWYHIYGLTITLMCPVAVGATTTYTPVDRNLMQVMHRARPTLILGVPKLYNVLYERVQAGIQKSALKRAIAKASPTLMGKLVVRKLFGKQFRFFTSGGAPLNPDAAAGFRRMGIGILEGYGLTETAPLLTASDLFAAEPGMEAIQDIELKILDPGEDGVGEVLARGPNIMAGYYKNPEATAEVIDDELWFHTGDLGLIRDGNLVLSGRAKNVIVLETGKNVYPEELEWEFNGIPAIEEIMVYEDERQGIPVVSALVYPSDSALKELGITNKDDALDHIWEEIKKANENLAMFKRIRYKECIRLVDEPFEKSVKLDIKRHKVKVATQEEAKPEDADPSEAS